MNKDDTTAAQHAADEGQPGNVITGEAVDLVGQASLWGNAWKFLRKSPFFIIGTFLLVVLLVMAVFPQLFARGIDPRVCSLSNSRKTPSAEHWFGTDIQGCDYYANVIYGARISLSIGVLSVIGVLIIGVLIGALAGYFGGFTDSILARFTDVFFGIPLLLGALILLTVTEQRTIFTVSLALVAFGWMTAMRLVRSSVIAIKNSEYVQAAQALGASTYRILVRHILPNALAPVIIYATISVGTFIAAEATLTFLGIGLQAPEISWGLQINLGQNVFLTAPHLVLFPAAFLSVTVLAFIMLGDALRDALDPKRN
ncbi:peptide/nickel transport system permease protein/oligopeptide transport system permease protein [Rhodococcus fascians]|jgi:oligopeptide transport system permease protein|uniref:Oligopeptide transport system permease protein OppC n=1 Tax=Rhodococcoides fascians TaxID=1828 RepID=A0A143QGV6_RHOFA|nr:MULTISPECIES: ABC transporter permease [Rhodococcus]AMY22280.1 Oligopeptide transport system permease protein OppC [Rhodococcus fascians]MDR6911492.1 peptide/nickel transport system permease protein/oligopeptide transport system permease protein [Rhodococcus sp. 3258]MDR6933051.1 peptide/nickel transport system permease protein/oligopeptide transport system permease protein [Rhodococcus fascians]OZC39241.1 peptide ABC transporter permease [Rhodococcus fascians]CAH0139470.1 Oligopeptide tran